MATLKLIVANKNSSTWSMRPWLLLRQLGIPFEEVAYKFRASGAEGEREFRGEVRAALGARRPAATGKVPALVDAAASVAVWDSLAIAEYVAEKHPDAGVWPRDARARAVARSVVAEMHSGFAAMRSALSSNVTARLPDVGERVMRAASGDDAARRDVERVAEIWSGCLAEYGGPFLFGTAFCAADAFYAPVVGRLVTYELVDRLPPAARAYVATVAALPAYRAWVAGAEREVAAKL